MTLTMILSLSVCLQTSVLHMCSLFHAFMFAQLWTIYCEQAAAVSSNQNQNEFSSGAILTGLEFWSRVTPSILQLMAHNKVVQLTRLSLSALFHSKLMISDVDCETIELYQFELIVKQLVHSGSSCFRW